MNLKAWLKRNYYKWAYRNKRVILNNGVLLDTRNVFLGNNVIGQNTEVASSAIGVGTYIADNSAIKKTIIGKYCSIGSHVQTGVGVHPSSGFVATHPAFYSTQKQAGFTFVKTDTFDDHIYIDQERKYVVQVGNDVWIGNNVTIADGVTIGDGAIIGTGAVVTKDVAPYTIVGGVPAKFIRYRFDEQQIATLLNTKWWDWDVEKLKENVQLFGDIESFLSAIK